MQLISSIRFQVPDRIVHKPNGGFRGIPLIILATFIFSIIWAENLASPCFLLELSSIGLAAAEATPASRRINDLFFFNNRLYLGYGDAVANTGPIGVIYYDLEKKNFCTEFTVDEEAIYQYQIIDNKLVIPGVDATEDWSFGNFYILIDSTWKKYRTIPNGIHINSITRFCNRLYASAGSFAKLNGKVEVYFGAIFVSTDDGNSWQISYTTPTDDRNIFRIGDLVVYKDRLYSFVYAYSAMKKKEIPDQYHSALGMPYKQGYYLTLASDILGPGDVLVNDGTSWHCEDLINKDKFVLAKKPFVFHNKLYIPAVFGEYINYLSLMDNLPPQAEAKLLAFDGRDIKPIKFDYELLLDVLIKKDTLYLLIKKGELYYIAVTQNLKNWQYFLIPPIIKNPKSIEFNNEKFYIGVEDGNIFESSNIKSIKEVAEAKKVVPKRIFGAVAQAGESLWYWVAITKKQEPAKIAQFSAEVKFGNIIKVTTENVAELNISPPFYYLNPGWDFMVIIDNRVVYEGKLGEIESLLCKKVISVGKTSWRVEKNP